MSHGDLLSRFRMLVAANCAPELSPAARTVLAQILAHFNAQTGQCTPSFDRLARTTGLARRSVVRAVRELRDTGWVERELTTRDDSREHLANSFRPAFDRAQQVEGVRDEATGRDETVSTLGTKRSPPPGDETVPRVGTKRCSEVGTKRSPKHSKKNTGKGTQGEMPVSPTAFDTWWQGYPRKVGKDAARPVFARILASGRATLEQLMAGAQRYAADRHGEEPRFTKHPKAWLNGGHWEDEIAPKSRPRNHQAGFSALAYVEERMTDDE